MKIVLLGPWPPPYGGVQVHLVALRAAIHAAGHRTAVINLTRHRGKEQDEVYYPAKATEVLSLIRRLRSDVIHLHVGGDLTPRLAALGALCSFLPGSRTVMTFHSGGFPSSQKGRAMGRSHPIAWALRRHHHLIAVNGEIGDFFLKCGVRPERISVMSPYAAGVPADALPEPLASFFAAHDPVLVTVGLLEPEYDLPLQIDVLGKVRESLPGAGLIIIGSGSLESSLRAHIDSVPWCDHVLLAGDVPHASTLRAIASASVKLRTTLYDGDALAVREALKHGVPVIATETVLRPPGVHLIPMQNAEALHSAILEVLRDNKRGASQPAEDRDNMQEVVRLYQTL